MVLFSTSLIRVYKIPPNNIVLVTKINSFKYRDKQHRPLYAFNICTCKQAYIVKCVKFQLRKFNTTWRVVLLFFYCIPFVNKHVIIEVLHRIYRLLREQSFRSGPQGKQRKNRSGSCARGSTTMWDVIVRH
jgi:hypothetical protein